MAYRGLPLTHIALPASLFPEVGRTTFEHWAVHQEWWKLIPFGWLSLLILAFWIGIVVQDLLNPNSALRHNWREWRKVFDVIAVMAGHVEGQTNDRVDIICLLKFRKSLTDEALTVRVIVPLTFKKRRQSVCVTHKDSRGRGVRV